MQSFFSQIKITVFLLLCMFILNALLWLVSEVELYGRNYMTPNVKFIIAYGVDIYSIFLILLTNFLFVNYRTKKDNLTHIFKYGIFVFSFLLFVLFADLRLVYPFHEPIPGSQTKYVLSIILNNTAYFMTTIYFVFLTYAIHNPHIKIASMICACSQILMLGMVNVEFKLLGKDSFIVENINLYHNLVDSLIYASFIVLAYTIYKMFKKSISI